MGLTFTLDTRMPLRIGDLRFCTGTIAFDNSYPTGGEAITAANVGFQREINGIAFIGGIGAGKQVEWDQSNAKLKVYDPATGTHAEWGNGTDPGLAAVRFFAIGW